MLITSQSKGTKTIYINSIRIIAYYDTERLTNISHLILKFKKKKPKKTEEISNCFYVSILMLAMSIFFAMLYVYCFSIGQKQYT
jgi:hypothetical protein